MFKRYSILIVVLLTVRGSIYSDEPARGTQPPDPTSGLVVAQQTMQQKQAQLETKRTAQRLEAMLRVLAYHQLDAAAEQKIIHEAATSLRGLSQQQMEEILKKFSAAGQAKSLAEMDKQLDQAQDKHRVVLDQIRQLLNRFELLRNVEQAALRLDKLAMEERQLHERVLQAEEQRRQQANQRRGMRPESPQQHALRQEDIARESDAVLQKLSDLKAEVPDELKPRLEKVFNIVSERKMLETMRDAANHLRYRNQREAEDRQIQVQNDLERLARTLRTPSDKLGVLTEARDRVQKLHQQQLALRDQTMVQQDPRTTDSKKNTLNRQAASQAEMSVQTRDVKDLLVEFAKPAAETLEASNLAMQEARDQLREGKAHKAHAPQAKAAENLAKAKQQLDELVAAEEKNQRDPLEALKRAMEQIDKIIADQKQLQTRTHEATAAKKPETLKPMATRQQYLAQSTEEIVAKPLAAKAETKQLIVNAAEAMHAASEQLHTQQGEPAQAHQKKAIDELVHARAALEAEAKAMTERREQIAELEQAAKKLEDIIEKETAIHEKTAATEKQNKTDDRSKTSQQLATKQGETRGLTEQLSKEIAKNAPDASKHATAAADKMTAATKSLQSERLPDATKETRQALEKLDQAKESLNDTLSQKQAEEAAAEAMQNPDKVMPAEAAIHVAKALMEAKEAAKQSAEAAKDASSKQSMKQSEAATKSAQAAIDQAKAMSPQNVQSGLGQARQDLNKAKQNLDQNTPSMANKNQEKAAAQLSQALQSLQQTMAAMEKMQGNEQNADAKPQQGKEGEKGDQQGKNQQASDAKNDKSAQGENKDKNQTGDPSQNGERDGNGKSEKGDVTGKSTFVNLPARQRELIMQALNEKLPPEHAAQIQRYFESIAGGKSASEPKKK